MKYQQTLERFGPFAIVTAMVAIYLVALVYSVLAGTNGYFSYPLDDVYIHMQVARNLAFSGTWGIQPGVFASASSSIFYPLLLSGLFRLFGLHAIIPFVVNCLAAIALIFISDKWLLRQGLSFLYRIVGLAISIILMPLPIVIISGMEHTLQTLNTFLFVTTLADYLSNEGQRDEPAMRQPLLLIIYSLFATGLRYEGIFLIVTGMIVLFWRKKPGLAFLIGISGALPILVFGGYSLSKGAHFLPNSVLLKSSFVVTVHDFQHYVESFFEHFFMGPLTSFSNLLSFLALQRMMLILLIILLLSKWGSLGSPSTFLITIILLGTIILHLGIASTGWVFRYEAYLIFCAVLITTVTIVKWRVSWNLREDFWAMLFIGVAVIIGTGPVLFRSCAAFIKVRRTAINIFEQQEQTAWFIKRFYDHSIVAVNDLGAVSYFTNATVLDLWGLGDNQVCNHIRNDDMTSSWVNKLCVERGVQLAVVYEAFGSQYFSDWTRVARLEIQNNYTSGPSVVAFYSASPKAVPKLKANLISFKTTAPKTIRLTIY